MHTVPLLRGLFMLTAAFAASAAAQEWKPLWDGKTFEGWRIIGKGQWTIENGAIRGQQVASEQEYGHLLSNATYGNFTARLKFKAVKGNSGLYFRVAPEGFSGVSGFQAEIDAVRDVGGLYETNGRAWVVQPSAEAVATWFRPGEWNEMIVHAQDGHVVVHVNGIKTAEVRDDPGRKTGHFALQVHGGQDCEVWFKDLQVQVK